MDSKRAVIAGIVGTAVMTVLLLWAPLVGLPSLAIGELLSTFLAVSVAVLGVGPAGGWAIHALMGIVFALLYAGTLLTITGRRELMPEVSGETYLRQEREIGKFMRTIRLPAPVAEKEVKANYQDGLLLVHLPKLAPAVANRTVIR